MQGAAQVVLLLEQGAPHADGQSLAGHLATNAGEYLRGDEHRREQLGGEGGRKLRRHPVREPLEVREVALGVRVQQLELVALPEAASDGPHLGVGGLAADGGLPAAPLSVGVGQGREGRLSLQLPARRTVGRQLTVDTGRVEFPERCSPAHDVPAKLVVDDQALGDRRPGQQVPQPVGVGHCLNGSAHAHQLQVTARLDLSVPARPDDVGDQRLLLLHRREAGGRAKRLAEQGLDQGRVALGDNALQHRRDMLPGRQFTVPHRIPQRAPAQRPGQRVDEQPKVGQDGGQRAVVEADLGERQVTVVEQDQVGPVQPGYDGLRSRHLDLPALAQLQHPVVQVVAADLHHVVAQHLRVLHHDQVRA